MTGTTISTAVAALDDIRRAGLAEGARRNAESRPESPREARFWLGLADHLSGPTSARKDEIRSAAADLDGDLRRTLAATLCRSRNLVATSDPVFAEFWSELHCLVAEVDHDQRATFRAAVHDMVQMPCESPG